VDENEFRIHTKEAENENRMSTESGGKDLSAGRRSQMPEIEK